MLLMLEFNCLLRSFSYMTFRHTFSPSLPICSLSYILLGGYEPGRFTFIPGQV